MLKGHLPKDIHHRVILVCEDKTKRVTKKRVTHNRTNTNRLTHKRVTNKMVKTKRVTRKSVKTKRVQHKMVTNKRVSHKRVTNEWVTNKRITNKRVKDKRVANKKVDLLRVGWLNEFRESRRCSRDTYPESYITEHILICEDKTNRVTHTRVPPALTDRANRRFQHTKFRDL